MKHIKRYPLNEDLIWDHNTNGKELQKDPLIKKWLQKVELDDDWFDPHGHNNILTPYGEIIKLDFYESGEYHGDGWWNFESTSGPDQYGISYFCPGGNDTRTYSYPEEIIYEEGEIEGSFDNNEFNPVKFILGLIEKQPLICSQIYKKCPENWREEIEKGIKDKGIDLEILKGGETFTSLLGDDI